MAGITSGTAIRAAVCALLDADHEVAEVLRDRMAFRDVGAFTTFPFLAIGQTRDHAASHMPVEEHIVTVHLWLKPEETEVARALIAIIRRALDRGPFRLAGADVISFRHEASGIRLAPELEALHATIRYRLGIWRGREPRPRARRSATPGLERMRAEPGCIEKKESAGKKAG